MCGTDNNGSFDIEFLDDRQNVLIKATSSGNSPTAIETEILPVGSYFIRVTAGETYTNSDYNFTVK